MRKALVAVLALLLVSAVALAQYEEPLFDIGKGAKWWSVGGCLVSNDDTVWAVQAKYGWQVNEDDIVGLAGGASGDGDTEFNSPTRLAFTAAAELLVADAGNARIMQYSVDFDSASPVLIETEGVPELVLPSAFSLDHFGNIFAADPGLSRVVKFDPGGGYLLQFGSTGTRSNQFGENAPTGLAINAALGKLFVCDPANNRILEYRI